jgi:hypothetical protein
MGAIPSRFELKNENRKAIERPSCRFALDFETRLACAADNRCARHGTPGHGP